MGTFRNLAVIACVCLAAFWAAESDLGASLVYGICAAAGGCALMWGAATGKTGVFRSFLGRSDKTALFGFGLLLALAGSGMILHRILSGFSG